MLPPFLLLGSLIAKNSARNAAPSTSVLLLLLYSAVLLAAL
jgi:hypothetical protein